MGVTPLLACPWRGASTGSVGSQAWVPPPATLWDAEQNGEPGREPWLPPRMDRAGEMSHSPMQAPSPGRSGWLGHGSCRCSRDPPQHMQAVHPPRDTLGGCSHQASSHLVGSRSGKSCRKAFLHLFVQTGDLSVARDLGKRQSQWDAAACARQLHSLCVAGLCYSSLWCLEASQGHLTCPRKGVIGSSERSALAPNCQHTH